MHETTGYRNGELVARTGLTVRTLHHYYRIGLQTPCRRSLPPRGPRAPRGGRPLGCSLTALDAQSGRGSPRPSAPRQ